MAITMMGRGASIDPQTLAERQRMADLMYQRSLVPAQNETSWTQGLARMLQGGISGYDSAQIQKDRDLYKEQKLQDMQKLGAALGTGDYKSVIGQLSDPDAQMMALGLARSDMENTNKFRNEKTLQDSKFENEKSLQNFKFGNDVAMEGMKQEGAHNLEWLKSGNRITEKRDEKMADPVKEVQARISNYTRVINDPNAPEDIKAQAMQRIEAEKGAMSAMKPPSSSVNIDMGAKGETQLQKNLGGKLGDAYADDQIANIKGIATATDQLSSLNRIDEYIKEGSLGNLQTTTLGQAWEKGKSRFGAPNDSGKIADFIQTTKKQLVDMRGLLTRQGAISNYEQSLLKDIALSDSDTIEAVKTKLHVFKQLANRAKLLGEITLEWKDRYGHIANKGQNGESFDSVVKRLVEKTPITSYEDYMKGKQDAASQSMGAQ